MKLLIPFTLLILVATAQAGTVNLAPGQLAPSSAMAGDVVNFAAGSYPKFSVRSGVSYKAAGAKVDLGGGDITIPSASRDVVISGFKFTNGRLDIGNVVNCSITDCEFNDIGGNAIIARSGSDGLKFLRNRFVNVRGYGCIEIYSGKHLTWMYNEYIGSSHGGHFLGCTDLTFSNNWGEGLSNWLCEIQDSGPNITKNVKIENNVALNYKLGWGNTGGIGMPGGQAGNPSPGNLIRNNYLRASFRDATFKEDRLHVAIELTNWWQGVVSGNVIGSDRSDNYVWTLGVGYDVPGAQVSGNKFFGKFNGGWGGNGTPLRAALGNNTWDRDISHMPAPPSKASVLGGAPAPAPPPVAGAAPSNIVISNVTDSGAVVGWKDNSTDETGFTVTFMPGNPADKESVTVPADATTATFTKGHPQWVWNVTVAANTPAGALTSSPPVRLQNLAAPPPPPEPPVVTLTKFEGDFTWSDGSTLPYVTNKPVKKITITTENQDGTTETVAKP